MKNERANGTIADQITRVESRISKLKFRLRRMAASVSSIYDRNYGGESELYAQIAVLQHELAELYIKQASELPNIPGIE